MITINKQYSIYGRTIKSRNKAPKKIYYCQFRNNLFLNDYHSSTINKQMPSCFKAILSDAEEKKIIKRLQFFLYLNFMLEICIIKRALLDIKYEYII